jgi:hypothetical protein
VSTIQTGYHNVCGYPLTEGASASSAMELIGWLAAKGAASKAALDALVGASERAAALPGGGLEPVFVMTDAGAFRMVVIGKGKGDLAHLWFGGVVNVRPVLLP